MGQASPINKIIFEVPPKFRGRPGKSFNWWPSASRSTLAEISFYNMKGIFNFFNSLIGLNLFSQVSSDL